MLIEGELFFWKKRVIVNCDYFEIFEFIFQSINFLVFMPARIFTCYQVGNLQCIRDLFQASFK